MGSALSRVHTNSGEQHPGGLGHAAQGPPLGHDQQQRLGGAPTALGAPVYARKD